MNSQDILLPAKMLWALVRNTLAPRVEDLILHVTNRCPLRCAHCFLGKDEHAGPELQVEEAAGIAQQLNPLIWLGIGGGEPFLREDLPDLCRAFRVADLSIPTSGWLVDQTLRLSSDIYKDFGSRLGVFVSIDGFERTHDRLRQPGSFEHAMTTLRGLKKINGLRVGVISTLSRANHEELPDLARSLEEFKLCTYAVNLLRSSPCDPALALPSLEELASTGRGLFSGSVYHRYKWSGPWSRLLSSFHSFYAKRQWKTKLLTLKEQRQVVPCLAGRCHLVIYANGDVAPCELLAPVGNIRTHSLSEIRASSDFQATVRTIRKGDCHCTHECNLTDSILLSLRPFFRTLLRRP